MSCAHSFIILNLKIDSAPVVVLVKENPLSWRTGSFRRMDTAACSIWTHSQDPQGLGRAISL
eukprot:COSAG02_NODE_840_length_16627_cov_11.279828_19_plen_62_part_00